ncbi:hypothetical protein R3Q06_33095 [Rhodococcus erythropolis]|uniref:hypothetical protein n=1 Tax=Rhodococcus erythropolis TaxID=1833 RepID=UPI00294965DF|nr:hypothetical protein [Rhodococcus erythropolis]MDV6278287.1 hypothetical protein [Rhodococcus erythropolis]
MALNVNLVAKYLLGPGTRDGVDPAGWNRRWAGYDPDASDEVNFEHNRGLWTLAPWHSSRERIATMSVGHVVRIVAAIDGMDSITLPSGGVNTHSSVASWRRGIRTMTASWELPFPPTAIRSITYPAPRRCVCAVAGSCSLRRGGGCPDMINVPSMGGSAKDGEPSSISSAGTTPNRSHSTALTSIDSLTCSRVVTLM